MSTIGKRQRVELRELWKHEERGFSAWLADNLDALADATGLKLTDPQREVAVGPFQVDLLCTSNGANVVIENQLEKTDHDHLGKLVTYLTNLEAKAAVWVTKNPRQEHVRAIEWLNETSPDDVSFYLVKLEAFKIDNSKPAPFFNVVVGPSADAKSLGGGKKRLAERHVIRRKFWEQLLALAKKLKVATHAGRSGTTDSWLDAGAGRTGFSYRYVLWEDRTAAELYIDMPDKPRNKAAFDKLRKKRKQIERLFGGTLEWERLDAKRASRIRKTLDGGRSYDEAKWLGIQEKTVDAMRRLDRATRGLIPAL